MDGNIRPWTQKDLGKDVSLTKFSHKHSPSTSCSQMVGQGHFRKPIKFLGRNYLPFINEGTTLNKRSSMTVCMACIESCGTGDIISSIKASYQTLEDALLHRVFVKFW